MTGCWDVDVLRAALEASPDGIALVPIAAATFAAAQGVTRPFWMRYRADLLVAIGNGISALRAEGWQLEVESLIGDHSPHEGAERVVVITALAAPTPTKENT